MHVESTCIRVLIECPRKQHGIHVLVLCMLNLPAFACQSNVPKMTRAHVCYSCSVLKWHMRSQTRMLEQHRHWATRVHPVLNSGTFDWHAIACSFSTFFFGVSWSCNSNFVYKIAIAWSARQIYSMVAVDYISLGGSDMSHIWCSVYSFGVYLVSPRGVVLHP